jgi:two-component system, chemotaxis family, chemotaxis protein CheY
LLAFVRCTNVAVHNSETDQRLSTVFSRNFGYDRPDRTLMLQACCGKTAAMPHISIGNNGLRLICAILRRFRDRIAAFSFWLGAMNKPEKSPRVMVVDDDTLMREVLKALLRDEKFEVVGEARDGQSALTLLERVRPDIVCLDVNMPGLSGIDVLKHIRSSYPDIRVVMITGDSTMSTVREAVGFGAVGYIIKPFKAGRVSGSLRAAMKTSLDSPFG